MSSTSYDAICYLIRDLELQRPRHSSHPGLVDVVVQESNEQRVRSNEADQWQATRNMSEREQDTCAAVLFNQLKSPENGCNHCFERVRRLLADIFKDDAGSLHALGSHASNTALYLGTDLDVDWVLPSTLVTKQRLEGASIDTSIRHGPDVFCYLVKALALIIGNNLKGCNIRLSKPVQKVTRSISLLVRTEQREVPVDLFPKIQSDDGFVWSVSKPDLSDGRFRDWIKTPYSRYREPATLTSPQQAAILFIKAWKRQQMQFPPVQKVVQYIKSYHILLALRDVVKDRASTATIAAPEPSSAGDPGFYRCVQRYMYDVGQWLHSACTERVEEDNLKHVVFKEVYHPDGMSYKHQHNEMVRVLRKLLDWVGPLPNNAYVPARTQ